MPSPWAASAAMIGGEAASNAMRGVNPAVAHADVEAGARPGAGGHADQRLLPELGEPDRRPGRERVAQADGGHQRFVGHRVPLDPGRRLAGEADPREVDPAASRCLGQVVGVRLAQRDLHRRMLAMEAGEDPRDVDRPAADHHADRDATSHQAADLVDRLGGTRRRPECRAGERKHRRPGLRDPDGARGAIQQL
jgi:hypothetical protein